jgi:GTP:adenosylcobinamide-phosphate guanylyltransferase
MDAVVLAGGLNSGALQKVSSVRYEAEIEIAGRPMLDYVIMALENVQSISRILVVGADSIISKDVKSKVALTVNPGASLFDSLAGGLRALNADGPVLVVSSDIPMITREAFEDFLERCRNRNGDIYYSFVSKEVNDQKYPGVQRTYVKLKDGVFTGGNLALLSPQVVQDNIGMLKKAALLRKKPIQLCSMLGWRHLFKLMTGSLTIKEIEERVFKAFKFTAVGIISPYPEVGIDVDKPSDLLLARQVLAKLT